jgi:arylsulfate sulfotransferase
LRNSQAVCLLFTAMAFSLASSGCGSGSGSAVSLLTTVAPTANPQVAQYSIRHFQQGTTAWVEFGQDTNYGRQTSVLSASATNTGSQTLNILVAGMLLQTTYHMRAHVDWQGGSWVDDDHTFTTGALPSIAGVVPQFKVSRPTLTPAPGVELLSLVTPSGTNVNAVATDIQGNIIWYCPGSAVPVKPMQNGHYITLAGKDLIEIDLACNTIRDVSLAQVNQSLQAKGLSYNLAGFSHDVLTLPNGHWITIIQITQDFTDLPGYPGTTSVLGDLVVDIDPNGNVVWSWSAFDYLDVNRYPYFGMPDWTHSNALVLTADNNLLLSVRNQSWILKLDYASGTGSGNVLWKLGQDGDFTILGGDPSQWFYGQHYPNILNVDGSQTTLAVYDDGNARVYSDGLSCGAAGEPACFTRATIFQLDESTSVANLLWQDVPGYFSFWGGSIDLLSNGDMEFDSSDPFSDASSLITEVSYTPSPQIVWQMTITGANAYRGYRIPSLYPGVTWPQ